MNKNLLIVIIIIALFVLVVAQSLIFKKIIYKTPNTSMQSNSLFSNKYNIGTKSKQINECINKKHKNNKNMCRFNKQETFHNANKVIAWGVSKSQTLEMIALKPNFIDKNSICFKNQIVINQKSMLSYFFNENKLWRKVISFENSSRPNMLKLHKMLKIKYGEPLKNYDVPTWKNYDSIIFIYSDNKYLHLVYDDTETRDEIMSKLEKSQLGEL